LLTEIEDRLVKIFQEKVVEVPGENILINVKPDKLPAIVISNVDFKFEKADFAENIDQGKIEIEERLNSDGVKTSYKLKEKPLKASVRVESPPGTLLTERDDYLINYKEGAIDFSEAPQKGKNNIFVKYSSAKSIMGLKSLKVKALYSIDVWGANKTEADSLAEKVVKALLTVEDELFVEGIESQPIEGMNLAEEEGKAGKIRLKYLFERVLRVEKIAGPIEKIEITSKNL
jgi:hypothetical protein